MNLNEQVKILLEKSQKEFSVSDYLSHHSVGDIMENYCCNRALDHFGSSCIKSKSKRSIEDFTILQDKIINYYDVKAHHIQGNKKGFSMPNLVSIKRLKKLIKDGNKTLNYIFIDYTRDGNKIMVVDAKVVNIYEIGWSNLTIGSLGYGQLQIKDNNKKVEIVPYDKESWEMNLKKMATNFYIKQIAKYEKQIKIWND